MQKAEGRDDVVSISYNTMLCQGFPRLVGKIQLSLGPECDPCGPLNDQGDDELHHAWGYKRLVRKFFSTPIGSRRSHFSSDKR